MKNILKTFVFAVIFSIFLQSQSIYAAKHLTVKELSKNNLDETQQEFEGLGHSYEDAKEIFDYVKILKTGKGVFLVIDTKDIINSSIARSFYSNEEITEVTVERYTKDNIREYNVIFEENKPAFVESYEDTYIPEKITKKIWKLVKED